MFDDARSIAIRTVTVGASVDRREQAMPGFTEEPIRTTTYRAGFDAFWEIDLFGRRALGGAGRGGHRREP